MVSTCPSCGGEGKVVSNPCKKCKGSGQLPKKRVITVKIPAGVHEGQGIRVTGEGEPGKLGGPRGDLYCYVRVMVHPFLMRDNSDLVAVVPISITQATLGGTIDVPSLDQTRQLKIPAGTQYGDVFRIKGQGLPDLRTGRRGDELIRITVEIPRKITSEQEKLLIAFAETEDKDILPESKNFFEKLKDYFGKKND